VEKVRRNSGEKDEVGDRDETESEIERG